MPWKNGRGVTTEIAIYPPSATVEDFAWRVSSATVGEDGAFSKFPGCTRDLAIIEGDGLELQIGERTLTVANEETVRFDGDDGVTSRLLGSKVRDLNLIFRKDLFEGRLEIRRDDWGEKLAPGTYLLYVIRGELEANAATVKTGEALFFETMEPASLKVTTEAAVAAWIRIHGL